MEINLNSNGFANVGLGTRIAGLDATAKAQDAKAPNASRPMPRFPNPLLFKLMSIWCLLPFSPCLHATAN